MKVDYNKIAEGFSSSRKNMKWEEIDYFISSPHLASPEGRGISVLDIGCGSGRLLEHLGNYFDINKINYLGVDLSSEMLKNALKNFSNQNFLELDMTNLDKIKEKFNNIFFIASFHHLNTIKDRKKVLSKAYDLLEDGGKIYMTNWALNSQLNKEKYSKSIIKSSENEFGSIDYEIKIGKFKRFYHCFDLSELEYLFKNAGFEIIENRLFDNKRNFISIIQKKGD